MVLAAKPLITNLRTWRTISITTTTFTSMASAIPHSQTLPFTRQILIARNLFLQSSTPARLLNHSPTSLHTRSFVTPLGTPMETTIQQLITSCTANRSHPITGQPFINSFPARTCPISLQWTLPAISPVASSFTNMLSTVKQLFTLIFAAIIPVTTIFLFFLFTTPATVSLTCTARRARAWMTDFGAVMFVTI